jgi:ribose transport system substrate-binding protein
MRRFAPSIALGFASLLILGLSPDHGYAESAGMAAAQAVVDAHSGTPAFQAPGPPIDIRTCAHGNKMLSIPNSSSNQFVRGVMDREARVGKEIGLTIQRWQNQGQPSQWVQGIDYAISNHFTIIDLIAGINPAVVDPQLRQANAAGVKSFTSLYYDVSQPPDPVLAGSLALNYHDDMGAVLADWMAIHSNGHARVIVVKSDEVLPTAPLVAGIHDEFKKNCPDCKIVQEINVGITEWATKIQPSLQSSLLAHPDANYVVPIYDSMTQFVVPAIALTGTAHRVKIATADGTPYVLDMLRRGQVEMDIGESLDWSARSTLDGYMRRMCNLKTPTQLLIPFHIFSAANIASAGVPARYSKGYGDAYLADFAKIWMMK